MRSIHISRITIVESTAVRRHSTHEDFAAFVAVLPTSLEGEIKLLMTQLLVLIEKLFDDYVRGDSLYD